MTQNKKSMSPGLFEAATGSSIHNPVTPQGAVLFTTAYDHSSSDPGNPNLNCFQRHDLLFRRSFKTKFSHGTKMNSIKLKTFSTCHSVKKVVQRQCKITSPSDQDIYNNIQFVGVSVNPVDANKGSDTYASALVSGLFTLVNTGEYPIEAGDVVVWTCTNITGLKDNVRMPMSVAPLHKVRRDTCDQIRALLNDANTFAGKKMIEISTKGGQCGNEDIESLVAAAVNDMNKNGSDRIIGQAVSSATQGKAFDILIGAHGR